MRRSHHLSLAAGLTAVIAAGVLPLQAAVADEVGDNGRNPYTRDAITYVFNGEANNLNAYDTWTWEKTRVITNATDRPHVVGDLTNGLDINAQLCFDPQVTDGYYFIAGEDTGQSKTSVGGGQGWGYFRLDVDADTLDITGAEQVGKVEPRYFATDSDNPENYGCGFLSDGNLVTGDVGDQFPQDPATGELILWFRPEGGFDTGLTADGTFPQMPYCKVDVAIPTAGQIYIGDDDSIYVGAQRPDTAGLDPVSRPGGVYKYTPIGGWPTSPEGCSGQHLTDHFTGEPDPMLVEGVDYTRTVFIENGPWGLTPTGIVRVPDGLPNAGNFYLSSVFDGKISEFTPDGTFVRIIMQPEPGQTPPYRLTGTPLGIGVDPNDGTIYFADIAVVAEPDEGAFLDLDPASWNPGAGPGADGMVRAIRFDADNNPGESIPVNGGLAFPDGIGIITIERAVVEAGEDDGHGGSGKGGKKDKDAAADVVVPDVAGEAGAAPATEVVTLSAAESAPLTGTLALGLLALLGVGIAGTRTYLLRRG